jgi:GNAT superfamily N-acetyltransferase
VRFLTFDELTRSMEADRLLVHLSALGGAADRRAIAAWRRRSNAYAEYVGIFAVEGGHVVGQTIVERLPYTFPDGTEAIGAIASVGTRPDRARAGVARKILTEVHRREREAGIRHVALWTNRSWGAHRLYESLGYRDVYAYPWAVRPPLAVRRRKVRSRGVRAVRPKDLPELERLHDRMAEGRIGFCHRPRHLLQTAAAMHEVTPRTELIVAQTRRRIAGYAHLQATPERTVCGELVAESNRTRTSLVAEVERRAGELAVAFQHTPVSDTPEMFRRRGYTVMDAGWYVLMAGALDREWSARSAIARFGTNDPKFLCLAGDRF